VSQLNREKLFTIDFNLPKISNIEYKWYIIECSYNTYGEVGEDTSIVNYICEVI